MLSLLIILILVAGFYQGYRRGLVLQGIRLIGYVITLVLTTRFYEPLSGFVEMLVPFPAIQADSQLALYGEQASFYVDQAFYRGLTFILIAIIGWLVTNFLSSFFQRLAYYDMYYYVDRIGGGIINFLVTYFMLFLILFILSLIPIDFVQQLFVDSPLAYWVVSQTPILSDLAINTWLSVNPNQ